MSAVTIYILKCEGGTFYVGSTLNLTRRLDEHFDGRHGSAWTQLHPPIQLIDSFRGSIADETTTVLDLMAEHGIEKVRGGAFAKPQLHPEDITVINKMLRHDKGACLRCGRNSHYVNSCYGRSKG